MGSGFKVEGFRVSGFSGLGVLGVWGLVFPLNSTIVLEIFAIEPPNSKERAHVGQRSTYTGSEFWIS